MKVYAFFLSFISAFSYGQEHLEPGISLFSNGVLYDYHRMVINGFGEAFDQKVHARVIVMPSFMPEYAIGLQEDNGAYRLFRLAPEVRYWGVYQAGEFGAGRNSRDDLSSQEEPEAAIKTCEREITSDLATSILEVWEAMLLKTKYTKSDVVHTDGVGYHFGGTFNFQVLSGQVISPLPDTQPGKFVGLVGAMGAWCEDGSPSNLASLELIVTALAREIN